MRYRPFARAGMALSALSLRLDGEDDRRRPADWRDLVHAAFEEGVNAFELVRPSAALMAGFAEGASAVRRQLLFVGLRLHAGLDAASLSDWIAHVIAAAGVGELNLLTADPDAVAGAGVMLASMRRLKDVGAVHRLAVAGEGADLEPHIESGAFDAIITPFNLLSGWRERHLIRTALERQIGVIGCAPCPPGVATAIDDAKAATKPGWFKRAEPLSGAGTYAFMRSTPGWTAEQICLAYALTEPALASVQVGLDDRDHLSALAEVAERDLPAAVAAQIEMARFSAERASGAERRSQRRSA